jgi:tRNA A-37 threonylcarbamoyl transferase component Bud32
VSDAATADAASPADGPAIPGFELLRPIGQGAAGTVYEARGEDDLGRRFAIKVFPPARRAEYERELATLRAIEDARASAGSQDLVETISAGETPEGLAYVVMAYAAGGDLLARVRERGPLPVNEALTSIFPVLRGLELLHAQGLVHKDVKPANVLLGEDGRTRLGDFGLARALDDGPLSSAGTPGFCAPELIRGRGEEADERLDVYSAAATLYFLLTGEAPLPGRPDLFLLERRQVDRGLQELLFMALAVEPDRRPSSPQALRDQLEAWRRGERIPGSSGARPGVLAVLLVVAALGGAAWLATRSTPTEAVGPSAATAPVATIQGAATTPALPPASPSPQPADPRPDAPAPAQPRWDGTELWVTGPVCRWDGGELVVGEAPPQRLFDREPWGLGRSGDGSLLAAAADDGEVAVWDLVKSRPRLRLPAVAPAGDCFPLVGICTGYVARVLTFLELDLPARLELFDMAGERLGLLEEIPVASALTLIPRDAALPYAALGTPEGRVAIVDLSSGDRVVTLQTHPDEILGLAVHQQRLLVLGDAREDDEDQAHPRLKAYGLAGLLQDGRSEGLLELPDGGELRLPD